VRFFDDMKGHIYRRNCTCKKKKCTCGSKWAFIIDIGLDPVTGKRKQKTKSGFKTKQEAETATATLIHELSEGMYMEETDQTFSEFANDWLLIYSEEKSVKPGTIRVRIHEINKLLPYFAQLKLKDITGKKYQDALNDLKDRGYSDSTREGIHRTGRMIFRKALEMEHIKKNPTEFSYLKKDKNNKLQWSKPEKSFIGELEKTDNDVLWWWKNGERESKYFGIAYKKDDDHFYGFYPDFIIKTKKDILVVEIKDDKDFKNENLLKLNAGKDFQKKYKGKEKLHFFIISPIDYFNFFKNLKEQNLPDFKSKYEENLLRFSQSRKVASAGITEKAKEDHELLDLYEKELSKAIKNLDNKKLENEILKIDLEKATATIGGLKTSLAYKGKAEQKQVSNIKIPNPFNICIAGEVADENLIRGKLQDYFAKYGVRATQWDISFFSNTKLRNSDVLGKLKKGQSKYNIVITGQIYHHSGKGNTSANILTELKKEKYIDHIIGCSPKDILTIDNIIEKIDEYLSS